DRVKKGQVIAKLEQTTALNDYEQAKADMQVAKVTLDQKEKEFNRQSGLYNKQLISEQEFETAKLGLETAKSQLVRAEAALSSAKEKLDDTILEAPMDGIILKKYVEEGQVISSGISNVSGGTLIATLADLNSVYVKADVDETDIGKVDFNQKVMVIADAFPEERFIGKVLRIAPLGQVDQNITVFQVTSQVNNSQGLLKAGMNVTVEIIAQDLQDVLLVPNEAVKSEPEAVQLAAMFNNPEKGSSETEQAWAKNRNNNPDKSGQFMVKQVKTENSSPEKFVLLMEKGKLKPVPVKTGASDLDFTEIKSGLKEGEEVLVVSVSQMMQDREAMKERMKRWTSMPGVQKK
ncbi:MAG: efflux RND transporter periplasmic adaptor subunit, partial [candidate division Zixibacteria bacterium]|nr:efflux RND transporter periplasmic adaptor subunit [candidate division Zixibacteria bacterium]